VNDVRVQRQALHHNDVVRCGSLWLRYVEQAPAGVQAAPLLGANPPPAMGMGMAGGMPPMQPMAMPPPPPISPLSPAPALPLMPQTPVTGPNATMSLRKSSNTAAFDEPTTNGGAEDPMMLRHQIAEAQNETRRVREDAARRVAAMGAELDRVRGELDRVRAELEALLHELRRPS
jgi:hypothetical protein